MSQTRSWPNGKRLAVLVSVLFETWSDGKYPPYFPRRTPLKNGVTDFGAIQWSQLYAGNEGVWRVMRVLDICNVRASFFCSGRSGELYPEAVRQIARSGHDVAGHCYTQDEVFAYMTPEQQRTTIQKVLGILEDTSGIRPEGWATAVYGWNEHTFDILAEEGVRWYADALHVSLPKRQNTKTGAIYAIPWSDYVDNRVLHGNPRHFFEVYEDTFNYLYAHEPMGLIHIGFHSHVGGRPLMCAQLVKVLRFLSGFSDVWFPRHRELIQWMSDEGIEELPYAKRFFG